MQEALPQAAARTRGSAADLTLERSEAALAWELRGAWAARKRVVVVLTDRCMVQRVEGFVQRVAVTGAFAIIDGWHVPMSEVLTVRSPHHLQKQGLPSGGSMEGSQHDT